MPRACPHEGRMCQIQDSEISPAERWVPGSIPQMKSFVDLMHQILLGNGCKH